MTTDHAIALQDFNSMLASLGFGFVMAVAFLLFIVPTVARPGRGSIAFILISVTFISMCFAAWAQSWHIRLDWNPEAAKVVAIVAACAIAGWIMLTIVQRAPPAAMFACLALLAGCGLCGALVLWAPFHNLLLLAVIFGVVALVAIIGILSWAIVRKDENRPIVIQQAPEHPQIEGWRREVDRGQILAAPRAPGGRLSAPSETKRIARQC